MAPDITPIQGDQVIKSPLPFSAGIKAGDFVFVSGMASGDENGQILHDTFENEVHRAIRNLRRVLVAAGTDLNRAVQVRCYLARQEDWDAHNRVYREYFSEPFPARTTLVGCLGDLVKYEIDCIAYLGAD
jgi:2-iminobutanoate/2-iminopropanoate deaminase